MTRSQPRLVRRVGGPVGLSVIGLLACGRTELLLSPPRDDAAGPVGPTGAGGAPKIDVGGLTTAVSAAGGAGAIGGAGGAGSAGGGGLGRGGTRGPDGGGGRGGRADGGNPCELPGARCGNRVTRVSVSSTGQEGDGISTYSRISGDGNRVAFVSRADNFFPKPKPGALELVVHDRRTKATTRVCEATDSFALPPAFTTDGAMVGYTLPDVATGSGNAVLCDWANGKERILFARGGAPGYSPQLSPEGRFAGFETSNPSLRGWRVVVQNLVTLEEASSSEGRLPWGFTALSSNANHVLLSTAKGLVRWDRLVNTEFVVAEGGEGDINFPGMSADGRFVAFSARNVHVPEDTNEAEDIYLYDVARRHMERISAGSNGENSNGRSLSPCISYDGRFVVYASDATNLVRGDTNGARDIFVFDREERTTQRVNIAEDGSQGNGNCHVPSISDDGRVVAYSCEADNQVPNDTNGLIDVFVVER